MFQTLLVQVQYTCNLRHTRRFRYILHCYMFQQSQLVEKPSEKVFITCLYSLQQFELATLGLAYDQPSFQLSITKMLITILHISNPPSSLIINPI